ncbi:MAG: molybdopterin-dependent oxidoreductase, partial [Candidatus Velthaea sp.]
EGYLLAYVHRALGVENLDWRAGRQYRAHPTPLAGTHEDLENAEVIVTYGRSAASLAPILDLRIRKAVARKSATLISVGDQLASGVLRLRHVASFADVQAALPARFERVAFVWDGTESAEAPALFALAETLRASGTHVTGFVLGEQPNARGAECVGMLPQGTALGTLGMLEGARDGNLSVLALMGVNPMLHFPDRELVASALRATPFVVVSELFMTETAELATLVLPACAAFEKSGTTTDLCGDVLPVAGSVKAPDSVIADGDMLVALADALGIALPLPGEMEQRMRALLSQAPGGDHRAPMMPSGAVPADALKVVVDSTIFTGGGTVAHDARIAELRTAPRAMLHPHSASECKVSAGDLIDLTAANGGATLRDLPVVLNERVPRGTVSIVDGLGQAPANAFGRAGFARVSAVRKPFVAALAAGTEAR